MKYAAQHFSGLPCAHDKGTKTHLVGLRGTHAVPSGAGVCGVRACVRAHFGGALSRYQVVFPSAPERALIVLLFNLLFILDAGQEPFSQT